MLSMAGILNFHAETSRNHFFLTGGGGVVIVWVLTPKEGKAGALVEMGDSLACLVPPWLSLDWRDRFGLTLVLKKMGVCPAFCPAGCLEQISRTMIIVGNFEGRAKRDDN